MTSLKRASVIHSPGKSYQSINNKCRTARAALSNTEPSLRLRPLRPAGRDLPDPVHPKLKEALPEHESDRAHEGRGDHEDQRELDHGLTAVILTQGSQQGFHPFNIVG